MAERDIMHRLQRLASKLGARLLRNNCGAYKDSRGVWLQYGVGGPGGSDLVGWKTVTVTPAMFGEKIAIFTAIEVKSPGKRSTEAQDRFILAVKSAGGIAGVAHCDKELEEILT